MDGRSVDGERVVDALCECQVGCMLGVECEQSWEADAEELITCDLTGNRDGDGGGRRCVRLSSNDRQYAEREGQSKEKHRES